MQEIINSYKAELDRLEDLIRKGEVEEAERLALELAPRGAGMSDQIAGAGLSDEGFREISKEYMDMGRRFYALCLAVQHARMGVTSDSASA